MEDCQGKSVGNFLTFWLKPCELGSVCMTQFSSSACEILDPVINLKKDEVFPCHIIPLPCLGWLTSAMIARKHLNSY